MEKIEEQLYNISLAEVPIGMHQFIMRKINYKKLRSFLFITLILLALNFIIIAWHINAKLIEAEFFDMTQDFFEVFSLDFSFINVIWASFFEIISPIFFLSAILSLIGAIYTVRKISLYRLTEI